MSSNVSDLSEGVVELVAEACCNDILARDVADKQCTPAFEDCDPETQTFWRHIARAALATLSPPASPQGVEIFTLRLIGNMGAEVDVQVDFQRDPKRWTEVRDAILVGIERLQGMIAEQNGCPARPRSAALSHPLSGDPI